MQLQSYVSRGTQRKSCAYPRQYDKVMLPLHLFIYFQRKPGLRPDLEYTAANPVTSMVYEVCGSELKHSVSTYKQCMTHRCIHAYVYIACVFVNAFQFCIHMQTQTHSLYIFKYNFRVGTGKSGPSHQAALSEFDFTSDVVCSAVTSSSLKLFIYPYIYMAIIIILLESPNRRAIKLPLGLPKNVLFIY